MLAAATAADDSLISSIQRGWRLRVDGKVEQAGQRVAQRVDLELENTEARIRIGAYAHEMIAHRSYGQSVHVAVEYEKVQIVRKRRTELLKGLID